MIACIEGLLDFIFLWLGCLFIGLVLGFMLGYMWRGFEVIRLQSKANRAEEELEFYNKI